MPRNLILSVLTAAILTCSGSLNAVVCTFKTSRRSADDDTPPGERRSWDDYENGLHTFIVKAKPKPAAPAPPRPNPKPQPVPKPGVVPIATPAPTPTKPVTKPS